MCVINTREGPDIVAAQIVSAPYTLGAEMERTEEYAKPVVVTDDDRLEAFLEKSKQLTPGCLGAYDKEDEVCTKFCACGLTEFDLYDRTARDQLNEPSKGARASFFSARVTIPSCRQEKKRLAKAVHEAEQNAGRPVMERMRREHFLENLGRVPVGKIRLGKRVKNFVSIGFVYIDRDQYLYVLKPCLEPGFDSTERRLANIAGFRGRKRLVSNYISILSQEVQGDTLVLTAKSALEGSRKVFGHSFKIIVKLEDALDSHVRMDDIGALD